MRILVAGGAGFLGSHLVDKLIALEHEVIIVDNLYTGNKQNFQHHLASPKFEFIRHDITEPINIEVDQIYNLACPASPVHYQKNPVETIRTSVLGSINLLDLARRNGAIVLQASTSEVYGDPTISPQNESYLGNVNPIGIRACYDEGKRASETLFFDYHRQHGVGIKVARIFNTYGPRMDLQDGRVVSNFIVQALQDRKISIYGDGNQTRSFCYVDDLIDGLMKLMNSDISITGPINLGNPNEFTMLSLARLIVEMTNSNSEIEYSPLPQDDPKQRQPDISLAKSVLGWIPTIELKEGLIRTIAEFESRV
jgi:UDP-glucuronate decarboxylase